METTLETLGALERRLNVAVPIADIEVEVKKRLSRLARTVKVAGFRPGKAPLRMLDQQYGSQLRSDVITERVQSTFNDAVREQNLRVAGTPRIEAQQGDQPALDTLQFSAVFEVYPEIQIGDVGAITITRPVADVTPQDVDRTLDVLRKQRTTYAAVDRPAPRRPRSAAIVCVSISPARSTASNSPAARRATSRSCSARAGCCPSSRRRSTVWRPARRKRSC